MQIIVDRIEDEYLVVELENGSMLDIPKELVPDAKEGDIIDIYVNEQATNERKKEVKNLMSDLFLD